MSEYQYHEWQAVDRILTADEQAAVSGLSSHIEVSSSRAMVTYSWGDFKHDPKQVLLKYFDAYFYQANWGSLRLMFRFPAALLDEAEIEPYCTEDEIHFETAGQHQVLDLDFNPEDGGGGWVETEAGLARFIGLRDDLLEGDYRLLYLAWLKAATLYGGLDEPGDYDELASNQPAFDREPPVPPGLKKLSAALQNFVRVFELDPFLVKAAAEASHDRKETAAVDYRQLISRLPSDERDDFLVRLAQGQPGAGLALRKRLGAFMPEERSQDAGRRTVAQLLERAVELKQAEQQRQAKARRQKHTAEMKDLAAREDQTWQQVEAILANGRKIASVYDEATAILTRLKELAEFEDRPASFGARLAPLARKYASRPSLIERWRRRGWL